MAPGTPRPAAGTPAPACDDQGTCARSTARSLPGRRCGAPRRRERLRRPVDGGQEAPHPREPRGVHSPADRHARGGPRADAGRRTGVGPQRLHQRGRRLGGAGRRAGGPDATRRGVQQSAGRGCFRTERPVEVGGPEVLTWQQVADVYSEVLGRRVRVVTTPGVVFGVLSTVLAPVAPVSPLAPVAPASTPRWPATALPARRSTACAWKNAAKSRLAPCRLP